MTREDKVRDFDASSPTSSDTLWGLPFTVEEASLVILPVPWEVTVSFGAGTAAAPSAIVEASSQVDLFNESFPRAWTQGVAMAPVPAGLEALNETMRPKALEVIESASDGEASSSAETLAQVNAACETMVTRVRDDAAELLERGKLVGVLGGDHSVPLGLIQALDDRRDGARDFGILHIDAHSDLRDAYEGFVHSHGSIMRNACRLSRISKIAQVGVRDFCEEEDQFVRESEGSIERVSGQAIARRRFNGEHWSAIVEDLVRVLPEDVYVSFDVDGLDPSLCPGTGTPVPGGLQYEEAIFLVEQLAATGRRIIGFDLSGVSPGGERGSGWDANVGARLLYRLSCAALSTQVLQGSGGNES